MAVRIVPTLSAMAEVYRLSTEGGPESPRFQRFVELSKDGAPVAGYTLQSTGALGTVEALLAIDAEDKAKDAANRCAEELGLDEDVDLAITVASPTRMTDRLATEIEHRLGGRRWKEIVIWTGEAADEEALRAATVAQCVRAGWALFHRPPRSVKNAGGQEGLAAALVEAAAPAAALVGAASGPASQEAEGTDADDADGPTDSPEASDSSETSGSSGSSEGDSGSGAPTEAPATDPDDRSVVAALDVFADDTDLASRAAFLYGDDVARQFGWMPLGVRPAAGYRYCRDRATSALEGSSAKDLLRRPWNPTLPNQGYGS